MSTETLTQFIDGAREPPADLIECSRPLKRTGVRLANFHGA